MAMSVAQGVAVMIRRLEALRGVHRAPIEAADRVISAELPVYTGAYRSAVKVDFEASSSQIGVSAGELGAANAALASELGGAERVYYNLHGEGPEGAYPLRIELFGGPASGDGEGAWEKATEEARKSLAIELGTIGDIR